MIHSLRTGLPFIAFLVGLRFFVKLPVAFSGPIRLWLFYGYIGMLATIMSPIPSFAFYWALNYLAVFAGLGIYLKDSRLNTARDLNYLSWGITFGILIVMVFVARDVLFVGSDGHLTSYGIHVRVGEVGGMLISRASGFARFAAVPAVASFVMFWGGNLRRKVIGACIFVPSALLVWFMQSRGAIFGLAFAMCFVVICLGQRSRWLGLFGATFCAIFLWTDAGSQKWINYLYDHISRGQAVEEIVSMTGRDRAWHNAWPEIFANPILGQGFQADRLTIDEHVHNTYMYALMTGGFLGAGLFCLGLVWAWYLFWLAWRKDWGRQMGQHDHIVQVGGVLAFFTVRSIPEVSGAYYSIDQFLMVPAIAYLTILCRVAAIKDETNEKKYKRYKPNPNFRFRGQHGRYPFYHKVARRTDTAV